jgi:hypothetical protein
MASQKRRFGLFAKYLSVLVPVLLVLAVPGLTAIVFFELRTHEETLSLRMGNQAARASAAFVRHNAQTYPSLAHDLLTLLAADRAFLCAEIRQQGQRELVAAIPAKIGCLQQDSENRLDMEIDDDGQYTLTVRGERVPVKVSSLDELGIVAMAYNKLLDREIEREQTLKKTNRALYISQDEFKRLNADLEERVRTRTTELHARGHRPV